jgi:hypothetical protein
MNQDKKLKSTKKDINSSKFSTLPAIYLFSYNFNKTLESSKKKVPSANSDTASNSETFKFGVSSAQTTHHHQDKFISCRDLLSYNFQEAIKKEILNQEKSIIQYEKVKKELTSKNPIKLYKGNSSTCSATEITLYNLTVSPYFWYFKDRDKFSPNKIFNKIALDSFKVTKLVDTDKRCEKNIKYFSNNNNNNNNNNRQNKFVSYYKTREKNKTQILPTTKTQRLKEPNKIVLKKTNLPKIKNKPIPSAKLRSLELSEKFIQEAKLTVYNPNSHSFMPRNC